MAKLQKLIQQSREHLEAGEDIVAAVQGTYETKILGNDGVRAGAFIATDRRLVFFAKKLFGFDLEVFPYGKISSIEMSKGFMGHKITVFASGNTAAMKWIQNGEVDKFVSYIKERISSQGQPTTATPHAHHQHQQQQQPADPVDQIRKLAGLKEQGILTEEEFENKKREILDSM